MTLLENINSRPLPLAQLMGITFTHAEPDKVIARMVVRPDLCSIRSMAAVLWRSPTRRAVQRRS